MRCHNKLNVCPYKFPVRWELAFNSYQQQERAVCSNQIALQVFELKLTLSCVLDVDHEQEKERICFAFLRFCSGSP